MVPGTWSIISLSMECCFLESYQPPWSKLYPVAKIWHGSGNTYIIYSSAVGCYFSHPSEAFTFSVFEPNFSGLGYFEHFKCSVLLSDQWWSWSQSPLLKLPSRTFSLELCTWAVQKIQLLIFVQKSCLHFRITQLFWQTFKKPQTVVCLWFQPGFCAAHLISSGHILLVSLSTLQGEELS